MPLVVTSKGNFEKTTGWLKRMSKGAIFDSLEKFGEQGVQALARETPRKSGRTADSWSYVVEVERGEASITWTNDNIQDGRPIAILIQMGHGTGTGGYVSGVDYINPALEPVFEDIAEQIWKEVTDQ